MFIQPDSEQEYLLVINAITLLGITLTMEDGKPVLATESDPVNQNVSTVSVNQLVAIPSQKSHVLKARLDSSLLNTV